MIARYNDLRRHFMWPPTSSLDYKFSQVPPVFLTELGGYRSRCEIKFGIFVYCTSRFFQLVYTDSRACCEVKVRSNTRKPLNGIVCDLEEYARPTGKSLSKWSYHRKNRIRKNESECNSEGTLLKSWGHCLSSWYCTVLTGPSRWIT